MFHTCSVYSEGNGEVFYSWYDPCRGNFLFHYFREEVEWIAIIANHRKIQVLS